MSLPSETVKPKLAEFAAYARSLKGDEKGEAQLFLDRFFRALGHTGIKEAGATLEFRIAKKPGTAQLELITDQPAAKTMGVIKSTISSLETKPKWYSPQQRFQGQCLHKS